MGSKPNAFLAGIEEKYRREYERKLAIANAQYMLQLEMAVQQCSDADLMAADDTFDVNEYSAEKFHKAHVEYMNKISHMAVVEDKEDPDMEWTKDTVDRRILQIVGKDNFVPWDERYFKKLEEVDGGK